MKLSFHATVPNTVDLELEAETGAIDDHLEGEVEVIELNAPGRRESRKQAAGHRAQVRRQGAHVDEVARVRYWWLVCVRRDEVVRHDERLPRSEVARVVERDRG